MPEQVSSNNHNNCQDVQPNNNIQMTVPSPVVKSGRLSVEPVLFLSLLSVGLSGSVLTQLLLVRSCQAMFSSNATKCELLADKTHSKEAQELEALVQPQVSTLQMYKTLIECLFPAVLSLFVGPWSDHHGRKPLILWPQLGYGMMFGLYAVLSTVPDLNPTYFLLASVPFTLCGGLITIVSGIYAFISDVSSSESRAFRMGMLDAALFGGLVVGTFCSAPLFSVAGKLGYVVVFASSSMFCLLSFLYMTFVPESVTVTETDCTRRGCSSLFDLGLVVTMVTTCCKKRERYGRAVLFLTIIAISSCIITMEGESAVSFLYTRKKFGWDLRKYTQYSSIAMLITVIGSVIGMYVFSVRLKIPDSIFAVTVFLLKIAECLVYAFAPVDWYMYLGRVVSIFGGVSGPLCRSIISKTVPSHDIGTVFSLTSSVEALVPLPSSPLYTSVYNANLLTFPGMFYVMSAAIFLVDVALISIVIVLQHISRTPAYVQVHQTEEDSSECSQ